MAKQNKGRKFFAASATAALVASAIVPVASAAQVNDYNKISGYAKDAVQALVDQGVIQGDTNGNFNPLNTVTRAQAAEIFTKALELEADGDVNFSDVKKGAWYYNSIAAVVANGIFEGVSANEFAPNKSLTRSEAAKVLVDAFGLEGSESLSQFADASQVKGWAKESLEIAVANGIFTGSEENGKLNLKPNAAITRQDFAVVFARTLDLVDTETPVDASIKAINNTTVEVTFDEEVNVDDVKAANFKIDGLEVKNASVKQTNKKVVVLTTEAQTADKDYVLSYKDEEIGKFKGVAAVIPTGISVVDRSIQGVTGKEVTVKAQVTVAEGQSKAGIPVTFYIAGSADGLKQPVTVEATTDADGVASYSYTRYVAADETVTAYASGDRSKFATGTVHWGVATQLVLEEVTTGATIQNGANKTYKIKYVDPVSGKAVSGKSLNVAFLENIDVTTDKLVTNATVNGVAPRDVSGLTTVAANVVTDSNGEAVFTVTGTNAKVTPVVYEATGSATTPVTQVSYSATALQVKASPVTFSATQAAHTITIKGEGTKDATTLDRNARKFTVTVTDKDGKAAANEIVKVSLQEKIDNVIGTDSPAYFVTYNADGTVASTKTPVIGDPYVVTTNAKGEATFYLASNNNGDYGTPVAWIDINNANGYSNNQLEATEPNAVGETTYFWTEKLVASKLVVKNNADNKEVTSVPTTGIARYEFKLTNQSGKEITTPSTYVTNIQARYNVVATGAPVALFGSAADATAFDAAYTALITAGTANQANIEAAVTAAHGKYVTPNRAEFLDVSGVNNSLFVVSADRTKVSDVSVTASATATNVLSPGQTTPTTTTLVVAGAKTVKLEASNVVGTVETGLVASYNTANSTITLAGKDPVKYAGESGKTYKFFGLGGSDISNATAFLNVVKASGATITYKVDGDNVTFTVISLGGGVPTDTTALLTAMETAANALAVTYNGTAATIAAPATAGVYTVTWTEVSDASNVASYNVGTSVFDITPSAADDINDTVVFKATLSDASGLTFAKEFTYTVKEIKLPTLVSKSPNLVGTGTGVSLAAGEIATIEFSEALSATAQTAIQTAIGNGLSFSWNGNKTLTITNGTSAAVALAAAADVTATITDLNGNNSATPVVLVEQ